VPMLSFPYNAEKCVDFRFGPGHTHEDSVSWSFLVQLRAGAGGTLPSDECLLCTTMLAVSDVETFCARISLHKTSAFTPSRGNS